MVAEKDPGFVVWIEGLPGAGKSTAATELRDLLTREGRAVEVLDGEEVRRFFSNDLGYSRKDREAHARRVSLVARMLSTQGLDVIVAMATPYETARRAARAVVGGRFVEVWLHCPLEVCQLRDPNGLYTKAEGGLLHHLTGVDDPFEDPLDPEIEIDTERTPAKAVAHRIYEHLHLLRARAQAPTPHP
jgi:adenylylsulfate kinase